MDNLAERVERFCVATGLDPEPWQQQWVMDLMAVDPDTGEYRYREINMRPPRRDADMVAMPRVYHSE